MILEPSKVFPCDCSGEGIAITSFEDSEDISEGEVLVEEDKILRDYAEAPYIQLSFWEYGHRTKDRVSWWWRLKIAWYVFRKGSPWADMVCMKAKTARHFANHLLYIIMKAEKEVKQEAKQKPIVEE